MKYLFSKLPSNIPIKGNFNDDCILDISEQAIESLSKGTLKLLIYQCGSKEIINNFQLDIAASDGNIRVFIGNDNSKVQFQENSSGTYEVKLWRTSNVVIGENTTSHGIRIVCAQSDFITGSDCMFSDGILVQSSDQHGLVDLKTGKIFNNKHRHVTLGNHVWLGRHCTLMPDVHIGDGSIIGTGAIVTSDIPEKSVAVGVPAKVIRQEVTWSRSPISLDEISKSYVSSFKQQNVDL